MRQGRALPISLNDRGICPICKDFIFTKIKPSRKFPNLQYLFWPYSVMSLDGKYRLPTQENMCKE